MKILILTIGSRGDVQPYVALGKGLKAAGHEVTLATCERFRGFVEEHGLTYGYISDDLMKIIDSPEGKALMEDTTNIFRTIAAMIKMARQTAPLKREAVENSWAIAEEAQPDLICFHPKAVLGPSIGEKLNIPYVLATPIPMIVPTAEFPCVGFPDLRLGGWSNRLGYRIVNALIKVSSNKDVRAWRESTGTPLRRNNIDYLQDSGGNPVPALHAISEYVLPRPSDWPKTAIMSGYWFLDASEGWTPPTDLVSFLSDGPPPLYIGFGSISGRDPKRLGDMVIDALRKSGHRGVLARGWGGLDADELPASVFMIDEAPHEWLFPQMAGVVHHGGAGSTAAGLRAGKPTMICPFFADQPFWGQTVHRLGAGPAPIMQKKLTTDSLANAFDQLIFNERMHQRAEMIGAALREEDGVARAVSFLETVAADFSK
ncbi:glycosyltransferase [Hoeflea prorocentri]|uniref:Glycosyltransferase n=1 Tax=Hoeflea prorocentri TaxID=1922333 RepID=A0A9X3ULF6_9HYPH|nr:glycosyltransferase [Hoeflea prorocentri]MCY6381156.1 glycosyltransferase [Hoeflea prorocentri]MDA5398956.1 glycosyltransferase [Hoeflea prorocentri]